MRRLITAVMVVATCSATVLLGQKQALTDQDKADAVRIGMKAKGQLTGLSLTSGVRFGDSLTASLNNTTVSTGFRLRVYTPMTWVEQLAANAAKEYRPFTIAEITEEMVEPAMRVIVYPDKPTSITAAGASGTSSVEHVVLRNVTKTLVVQPSSKEPFEDKASSALRDVTYQGMIAKFPLDAVRELRGPKGDKEFIIVVIGAGAREKEFTVKEKNFERLP